MNSEPGTVNRLTGTALLLLASCAVTPLTNKIKVGEEAFVVAVGEGPDSMTDLYAAPAGGGAFWRLTFNRLQEALPRLSSEGTRLAFLRSSPVETTDPEPEVVVLDLLTGRERGIRIPRSGGSARAVAWLGDSVLVVRSDSGLWRFRSAGDPGLERVSDADSTAARSALEVILGDPPSVAVVACTGGGLCVRAPSGDISPLDSAGSGPVRWGGDSVGYFTSGGFEVRPLAGGHSRHPLWSGAPGRLRELTFFEGREPRAEGRGATAPKP